MLEQETKGAWRYREVDEGGNFLAVGAASIGVVYLRKSAVKEPPGAITLTIRGGE
jgi:hypothetical protein